MKKSCFEIESDRASFRAEKMGCGECGLRGRGRRVGVFARTSGKGGYLVEGNLKVCVCRILMCIVDDRVGDGECGGFFDFSFQLR